MFLYAILLLGVVIFIHELGHFLAARLFNVKVFIFSLGFGKTLFKYQKGETEYRISLIPLGGYVKMLGEGMTDVEVEEKDLPRAFSAKKWWQKIIIVAAGPIFNILLAMFIYFLVSFTLYNVDSAIVEYVSSDSPAAKAGIEEGDTIISVGDKKVFVWEDIANSIPKPINNDCSNIEVKIKKFSTGKEETLSLKPEVKPQNDLFGNKEYRCIAGIMALPKDSVIAMEGNVPGFPNGAKVTSIDNKPVDRFYKITDSLKKGASLITIEYEKRLYPFTLNDASRAYILSTIRHGGNVVNKVELNSVASKLGLMTGDFIIAVNGRKSDSPIDFMSYLRSMKEGDSVNLDFYRNGELKNGSFKLSKETSDNQYTGMSESHVKWGSSFLFNFDVENEKSRRGNPLLFSFSYAISETWKMTELTVKGLYYLASGKLSTKSLGGPIMVFDISKKAAERGIAVFLSVMAMISINLGIINFLPVPVLDGGHIVMYTVEGILRKEINKKLKEKMMATGFALLMLLMAFAIFNDINRYFSLFTRG